MGRSIHCIPGNIDAMKLLIVEDNRDIAENIADYLEPRGHSLDFAAEGISGLKLAEANSYDAIVLDIMMPGIDGLTVCRRLRQDAGISTPVIMLTARDQLDDKLGGFHAGADDYLVKPFSVKELEARLEAVVKRSQGMAAQRLSVADLTYDTRSLEAIRAGQKLELNPIQRTLLAYLMANTYRVVPREELEARIWGEDVPDRDVLRTHIYGLRNVIDKPFEAKLLHTIHGSGYRLAEES